MVFFSEFIKMYLVNNVLSHSVDTSYIDVRMINHIFLKESHVLDFYVVVGIVNHILSQMFYHVSRTF